MHKYWRYIGKGEMKPIDAEELLEKLDNIKVYHGNRHPNTNCLLITKKNVLRLIHRLMAKQKVKEKDDTRK